MHNNHCHRVTAHLQLNILLLVVVVLVLVSDGGTVLHCIEVTYKVNAVTYLYSNCLGVQKTLNTSKAPAFK
jgi:hypothetical protein